MGGTWAAKAEENMEQLFTNAGKGAEAARMIEISPANKILADREQAILLQICDIESSLFMNLKPVKVKGYTGQYGAGALAIKGTVLAPENDNPVSPVMAVKEKVNKYQWVKDEIHGVELAQATIEGKTRSDFKEVAIAQGLGLIKKFKGEMDNLATK